MFGLLLVGAIAAIPAGGQSATSILAPINDLRGDDELPPMAASAALDAVAAHYLAAMVEDRCLCAVADGEAGAEFLLNDVRLAIGSDAAVLDAGLVVGYDRSANGALTTAVFDPANGAAILGERLRLVGVATAVVEGGERWLAPPPGGIGPEIDLNGYTLVVTVTAGPGV